MRTINRIGGLLFALAAFLLTANLEAQSRNPGYRIGPKDLVRVNVFEVPELNVERRVTENGMLSLPLIGDIPAAGFTEEELSKRLKDLLESKLLQRASTEVQVLEFQSKPISVIGAVKTPGNLAFSGSWTLLEAITASGGLAENHGGRIYVLRRPENGLSDQIAIDVADLMVRADPRINIPIFANDLINVPATVDVTIYCLGEVERPGALEFRSTDRLTLLAAVARAGGLTDRASSKIQIKRSKAGTSTELSADYKRILAGKDNDVELQEGDVVVVKESFF
jgi:polysaccharide biosynthesis/export protein